jgi:hypothetical protein
MMVESTSTFLLREYMVWRCECFLRILYCVLLLFITLYQYLHCYCIITQCFCDVTDGYRKNHKKRRKKSYKLIAILDVCIKAANLFTKVVYIL